jgi:hypothetical protein
VASQDDGWCHDFPAHESYWRGMTGNAHWRTSSCILLFYFEPAHGAFFFLNSSLCSIFFKEPNQACSVHLATPSFDWLGIFFIFFYSNLQLIRLFSNLSKIYIHHCGPRRIEPTVVGSGESGIWIRVGQQLFFP